MVNATNNTQYQTENLDRDLWIQDAETDPMRTMRPPETLETQLNSIQKYIHQISPENETQAKTTETPVEQQSLLNNSSASLDWNNPDIYEPLSNTIQGSSYY